MEKDTYANDSPSASIHDDDIYYDIVGGKNGKENVYGLGRLSNKFTCSTHVNGKATREMRKTIHKLNNELIAKEAKKKPLGENMVQLMHNHKEQSEQIHHQSEKMEQQI
ncbi:hypothetical protein CR513_60664, partial [Mucuna pruriens]